ncbi:phenylacetate--CoA ligase family protein [Geothermobacter hydrogeniphilus]|uniref:AMP-dependent synthetase n=1 Tax=Geothermobacter hydrogeniphilus TaxID=1969733 RepID=A0A1X0XX73_9BACT|nr:AMP-binding protein [Geothermobacter hydrogeniphilus]ORJ57408.1 AMP-dependent synthetase [Geothermobacter hydrogeniphilus]
MSDYYDNLETRTSEQREADLFACLADQIDHAKSSAPAFAETLHGIDGREVTDRAALAKLPLLRKTELIERQQGQPVFGGLTGVEPPELCQIFASPGPIFEPGSTRPDFWRFARALYAAGFRSGDIIHNCFSYHFTPAGMMFESGARALGCATVPAGVGQTELQVQVMGHVRPRGYVGTPSFLKLILDKADELGSDLSCLETALVSGEYLPPSLREGMAQRGISVRQCYATADLGLIAYESEALEGMIVDEGIVLEIVRPGSGDPVPEGEVGEVVVTSLNPDYPLIRFATGDLSAILPGPSPCGRTNLRIKGWLGRADQTTKVRGMFVHPQQVDAILKRHPEIGRGRLVVTRQNDQDHMLLRIESAVAADGLASALRDSIRELTKLRGEVEFVAPGSLPNDGKVIDDQREIE